MIFTSKIQDAINFSDKIHRGQKRKGKETPYVIHPLIVSLILARIGAEEDVIIAGLLHDVIEDAKGNKELVAKEVESRFGKDVARMVDDVTEKDKSLPWEERKRIALEHIPQMRRDSLLVKSADVVHNMADSIEDLKEQGEEVFKSFNAPKEKQLKRYQDLISELERCWPENPLLPEFKENLQKLLKFA